MNSKSIPSEIDKKYCHKVLFDVNGHLAMVHSFIQMGIMIKMDDSCKYACACFDNTHDYNNFKSKIAQLSA